MKIYDKLRLHDPNKKRSVGREIKILYKLEHPNLLSLHECIETNQ